MGEISWQEIGSLSKLVLGAVGDYSWVADGAVRLYLLPFSLSLSLSLSLYLSLSLSLCACYIN